MNIPSNLDINKFFLNYFTYPEKNDYSWDLVKLIKQDNQDNIEVLLFLGKNKKDEKITIYTKEIKFSFESNNNNEIKRILKEVFFKVILRNCDYFVKLDKMILSDESNSTKRLFLIFKGNNLPLSDIINISNKNENEKNEKDKIFDNKDFIKYIIYQIASALYFLHSNNIVHNDLKPNNILINNEGKISIADFGSISYKGEDSLICTFFYSSPDFLNDVKKIRDEKSDMWALGVIITELLLKKIEYFKNEEKEIENSTSMRQIIFNQLKFILSKFGVDINNLEKEKIKDIIDNKNEEYEFEFTEEEEKKINDDDAINLIKNLLVLNPNKRYSAEEVLKSAYLECYIQDFPHLNNMKKPLNTDLDYNTIFSQQIDRAKFEEIFKNLDSKLNE